MALRLFTKTEAQSAKRLQESELAEKEQSFLKRIETLQKTFNSEIQSVSEYREQMNQALEEEMLEKRTERDLLKNEILLLKVLKEELKKPLDAEKDLISKDRADIEVIKIQISDQWREIEEKHDFYDKGLQEIGRVKDRQSEKSINFENQAKSLLKQSELVQSEMNKLENIKCKFEEGVSKTRYELENRENKIIQNEKDNQIYRKEIADREFQVKQKERILIDREERIKFYEQRQSSTN